MEKFVEMDDAVKTESHLTSAAAFVEGGIQEACDDTCSICLEDFCESDPSTVTTCKHEFHLQCILEWCQRSSQCPMCWQPISLKDPSSQELLKAVESERNLRMAPARNTAIFHHPTLGNFELRHLPVGVNDADIEERIIQHLAAAAAMGRAHIGRREGQRGRPSHGRPHFLVFTHPSRPAGSGASGEDNEPAVITVAGPSSLEVPLVTEPSAHIALHPSVQTDPISSSALGSAVTPENHHGTSSVTRSPVTSHPPTNLERAGPSEFQSFSESLKTKFNSVSMRYKESISNSTKGWKDKLFPRDTSMSELGSVVRREVNAINYISEEQYNELRASIESLGTGLESFQSMYLFRQDQFETLIISQLEHLAAVIQNLHHRIDLTESNQSKAIDDVISSVRFHSSHLAAQLQRDFDKIITHIGDLSTLMTRSAGEPSHAVENLDENDENLEAARPATSTVPSSAEHLDVLLNTDVAVVAQDIGTDVAQEVALLEVEPVPAPPIEDTPMEDAGDAINADSVPPSSPVEEISHQAESPPNKDDFLDQLWDIMHWENLSSSEL